MIGHFCPRANQSEVASSEGFRMSASVDPFNPVGMFYGIQFMCLLCSYLSSVGNPR